MPMTTELDVRLHAYREDLADAALEGQVEAERFTEGQPARFRSSEHAERCFCPRCGTPLAFASDRAPGDIDVTTSTLDRPESVPPRTECHVADKLAWSVLDPSLPAHREGLP